MLRSGFILSVPLLSAVCNDNTFDLKGISLHNMAGRATHVTKRTHVTSLLCTLNLHLVPQKAEGQREGQPGDGYEASSCTHVQVCVKSNVH